MRDQIRCGTDAINAKQSAERKDRGQRFVEYLKFSRSRLEL